MAIKQFAPTGIIDIGSNSVRFVAYGGTPRVPSTLFNEKVMAALGRGLAVDGKLGDDAMARTLQALARFRQLGKEMGLKNLHTVATAAVRDAKNGPEFLKQIRKIGLKPRLLSGEEEAELSGLGVISAIPKANGIVADLGGGSLELIGVARGAAGEGVSLPLGVLRVEGQSSDKLAKTIRDGLKGSRLKSAAQGNGLYLVGGSFRALALLDMKTLGHPLPIVHHHRILPSRIADLKAIVATLPFDELKSLTGISASRVPTLPAALSILEAMNAELEPRRIVTSAFGLREGLLYRDLDPSVRAQDPLLAAALEVGERLGRFGDHGALLDEWMDPLFHDETQDMQRLRLAACLLGDIAWNAHPDYRADRAVDLAIHGNWVGIDSHGRAVLGLALSSAFGEDTDYGAKLSALLHPGEEERVKAWGKAIRLAQRLSGGTEMLLRKSSISLSGRKIILTILPKHRELFSDTVERRLVQLGKAMARDVEVRMG